MEHYLSITEMARRRGITTETLRYYDRIGLLKPDYLDQNRVRYYSVLQYEKLETIRELRQLGLELKEIAQYLSDRRVDTSYELLLRQRDFCREKIRYYRALEEKISGKIDLLSELNREQPPRTVPELLWMEERPYVSSDAEVTDDVSLAYACMELEQKVKQWDELAPVYASDCYAGRFSLKDAAAPTTRLLFFLQKGAEEIHKEMRALPAGRYLRLYSPDSFWQREAVAVRLGEYAEKNGLHLSDEAIVISKVDYSITDDPAERLYEVQVRVL